MRGSTDADRRGTGAQRGVALRMAAALAITLVGIGGALRWGVPIEDATARLTLAARFDLLPVATLAAAIANVARLRFVSPADIDGSAGGPASPAVATGNAILRNTLEQLVLALPVHLALALLRPDGASLVAVLAASFAVGRLLFWHGYRRGAAARALGFGLTFYPTVAGLVVAAVAAVG